MRVTTRLVALILFALSFTTFMLILTLEKTHSPLLQFATFHRSKGDRESSGGSSFSSKNSSSSRNSITKDCLSKDMKYWREEGRINSPYVSANERGKKKYVGFEYDHGGWNNIRMGMECVLAFALGSERTVVLPPASSLYLLDKKAKGKTTHSFLDFFDLNAIEKKFPGTFIEFEEFVKLEGAGLAALAAPPSHDCDALCAEKYMRAVAKQHLFDAGTQCLVFRKSSEKFPLDDRIKELCGTRRPIYFEPNKETDLLLHLPVNENARLLAHFYAFVMFDDLSFDRHVKRWMRDYMHYREEIFCVAAPVVRALHKQASEYHALHIRRNDFQFQEAWLDMPEIADLIADVIPEGSLVYISSDEQKRELFKPFTSKYRVKFLADFIKEGYLEGVNPNLYGMIEQIVASHADRFVGTWWSTFTGYINRMRGYRAADTRSWYYPKNWKYEMQEFRSPDASGWWREWPVAWRDIDEL